MLKAAIIGASGYTGVELAKLITTHPQFTLSGLYVSANSADANKPLTAIDGRLPADIYEQPELALTPIDESALTQLATEMDLIFLALPHEVSHNWAAELLSGKAKVLDLSGAFRLADPELFTKYYGFEHQHTSLLSQAVYGLAEWHADAISQANLVAVPGCYPTAALTALKPLFNAGVIHPAHFPIINATSGVSGAGRKATLTNSLCEVSLQAYGVLGHRHQPEITAHLGQDVIFTPHLGNFKRGILATSTVKLAGDITAAQIDEIYHTAYAEQPLISLRKTFPKLDDVVHSPGCHLAWKLDEPSQYLVVSSVIDNLLKGAASQAIQCANLVSGFASETGLMPFHPDVFANEVSQ